MGRYGDEAYGTRTAPMNESNLAPIFRPEDTYFLDISRKAYSESNDWWDASMRRELEDAQHTFNSEHPSHSKYHTEAFAKRSRLFRPKIRIAVRNVEAKASIAAFATADVVHCQAANKKDEAQVLGAKIHNAILNTRLNTPQSEGGVDWFKVFTGAVQLAAKDGTVISKQTWKFREREYKEETLYMDVASRETFTEYEDKTDVIEDRPDVKLCAIENFRFSPAANWMDVIGSSPFLIYEEPMYIGEIKKLMEEPDEPGGVKYYKYDDGILRAAINKDWDSIRSAREGDTRQDRFEEDSPIPDHQVVWRREYIMDIDGEDWVWWTLGGELMLAEPIPLEEVYFHGRPFVMGHINIEALKVLPAGIPKLMAGLSEEAQDIANLRIDNVRQAVLRRNIVKRNSGVDIRALTRGVPGSTIMVNDMEAIKTEAPEDVTKSSYEEQDRLNIDMDDLTGSMNKGTVGSARNLGDTVGGLEISANESGGLTDFMIRTFVETWSEPVLRQLVKLESHFEQDEKILEVAAQQAGVDVVEAYRSLKESITVKVDIGYGATSPTKRIQKITLAMNTVIGLLKELAPQLLQSMDFNEFIDDIFGAVGMDATRYFPFLNDDNQEDPRIQQFQQTIQELQQVIQMKQVETKGRTDVAMIGAQSRVQVAQMGTQVDMAKLELERNWKSYEAQVESLRADLDRQEREISQMTSQHEMMDKNRQIMMQKEALNQNVIENQRAYYVKLLELAMKGTEGAGGAATGMPAERGPVDLPGANIAGVIARENFDMIPADAM